MKHILTTLIATLLSSVVLAAPATEVPISANALRIGTPTNTDKTLKFQRSGSAACIKWDNAAGKLKYSVDCSTYKTFGLATDLDSGAATAYQTATANGSGGTSFITTTSSSTLSNVGLATSVSGNALTIALKQADGSTNCSSAAPCLIGFGSSTASSGAYHTRAVTGALSITVPSGATLGCNSGSDCYIFVYALDNSGTVELAVSSYHWEEVLRSTTTIGTGADDADLFSATGRTAKAIRAIGRLYYSTAPNGTYSSVPSELKLATLESLRVNHFYYTSASIKTPTASGNYSQMTGNSVTLQPGAWLVRATARFWNGGSDPVYSRTRILLLNANGADSSTPPADLTEFQTAYTYADIPLMSAEGIGSSPDVRMVVASSHTVYAVPYATVTTPANARIAATIYAERLH
jgi:hypothetical protein